MDIIPSGLLSKGHPVAGGAATTSEPALGWGGVRRSRHRLDGGGMGRMPRYGQSARRPAFARQNCRISSVMSMSQFSDPQGGALPFRPGH